jgi:GT2 family glycosyltransferase
VDIINDHNPGISVIVATRNRARSLATCLDYMSRIEYPDWELIVVDNGSTDDTVDVVSCFASDAGVAVHLVREPRRGLTHAQNAGIAVASKELIAFTDDDCYVAPTWLREYARAFEAHPELGFATGRIVLFDPTDAPITIYLEENERWYAPRSVILPGSFTGANLAFRRQTLDAIGGFDLFLGPGQRFQGCDVDACARASMAGLTGAYLPAPTVAHHHGRKPESAEVRALEDSYTRGRGAFFAKCCLRAESRTQYARSWYWSTRRLLRQRRFNVVLRELQGGVEYWLQHTLFRRAPLA